MQQTENENGGPCVVPEQGRSYYVRVNTVRRAKTPIEKFNERRAYELLFFGFYLSCREIGLPIIECIGRFRRTTQIEITDVRMYAIIDEMKGEFEAVKNETK